MKVSLMGQEQLSQGTSGASAPAVMVATTYALLSSEHASERGLKTLKRYEEGKGRALYYWRLKHWPSRLVELCAHQSTKVCIELLTFRKGARQE